MAYRNYSVANSLIVDQSGNGDFTTITAALAAASAGDTIALQPGTYTENFSLKNGVQIVGLTDQGGSGERTKIVGKMTAGASLSCVIENVTVTTNSDYFLEMTGSSSGVTFTQCRLVASNNTGININNAGATVSIFQSRGDVQTTGIGLYTGIGAFVCYYSSFVTSGSTVTASTTSGTTNIYSSQFSIPISSSGAGGIIFRNGTIDTSPTNATCITAAGTGQTRIENSSLLSGTASALSIGSGAVGQVYKSTIDSTNTNPVTGAGTYKSDETTYSNTGILPNPTTETFALVGRKGTFTPVLTFGGGSTGITYVAQSGTFLRIGNQVTFTLNVELSAKGSSTGAASISGLPYSPASLTVYTIRASALTFLGQVLARSNGTAIPLEVFATTGAITALTDTAFANGTFFQISGSYVV